MTQDTPRKELPESINSNVEDINKPILTWAEILTKIENLEAKIEEIGV